MKLLVGILVLVAVVAAALPIDDRRTAPAEPRSEPRSAAPAPAPTREPVRDVPRSRCPDGVPGCRAVRGTVLYVERVDPDGDGDLHVVVDSGSITLPGMTAVDVRPDLRPRRDPRVGDRVSAAGPVQPGSYGQSQIHALKFRVHPR
jgi:hypothetical protein